MTADPDDVWRQVRELEAAWDAILRGVRAGEITDLEASVELRELLWTLPVEVLAMGSRRVRLKRDLRADRKDR